jgi:hypothetical protein
MTQNIRTEYKTLDEQGLLTRFFDQAVQAAADGVEALKFVTVTATASLDAEGNAVIDTFFIEEVGDHICTPDAHVWTEIENVLNQRPILNKRPSDDEADYLADQANENFADLHSDYVLDQETFDSVNLVTLMLATAFSVETDIKEVEKATRFSDPTVAIRDKIDAEFVLSVFDAQYAGK